MKDKSNIWDFGQIEAFKLKWFLRFHKSLNMFSLKFQIIGWIIGVELISFDHYKRYVWQFGVFCFMNIFNLAFSSFSA